MTKESSLTIKWSITEALRRLVETYRRCYLLIQTPKTWVLPSHCDVLIIYDTGPFFYGLISSFFEGYEIGVMYKPLGIGSCSYPIANINIPCLIGMFFSLKYWKKKSTESISLIYTSHYIRMSKASIAVTLIDNEVNFSKLSKICPQIRTIFFQNGVRDEVYSFSNFIPDPANHTDLMLVFNKATGRKYLNYMTGKAVAIGSVRNNSVPVKTKTSSIRTRRILLFISQWRPNWDETYITFERFYEAEKIILLFLSKWCELNNYRLAICGASRSDAQSEKSFFSSIIFTEFEFYPNSQLRSYLYVDDSDLIVSIDSSMGYESLARGNKNAIFSIRSELLGWDDYKFGWPGSYESNGPFWTNHADEQQFKRILDYLSSASDAEWLQILNEYAADLISYDPGCFRTKAAIEKIIESSSLRL